MMVVEAKLISLCLLSVVKSQRAGLRLVSTFDERG